MRAVIYTRVSTKGQADSGLSLADQESVCRSWCEAMDYKVHSVARETASGGDKDRAYLAQILSLLTKGEAGVIVVAKLDRLTRSVYHFGQILEDAAKWGFSLVCVRDGLDTSSASGRLVANIMASVAQWEREIIGERTRHALAERKRQGHRLGRPPSEDPTDFEIDSIQSRRMRGDSIRKIAEDLGFKESTVRRLL